MKRTTAIVIGAGQAGLAASHCLARRGIDHVILERGEVANSWRHERWDSLRLLTPNWQCRLPGKQYAGPDPEGFMPVSGLVRFLDEYAATCQAPIHCGVTVSGVSATTDGYRLQTSAGPWACRSLIIATGPCNRALVPACASGLPNTVHSLTAHQYRNPGQLPEGGVLVVGAAASGIQIADELQRSGRQVYLSTGEHVRMPRRYRGRDILWWMDRIGLLDETWRDVDDITRARRLPSSQLIGTEQGNTLDLNALTGSGVELLGRLSGVRDGEALFSGSLNNVCKLADLKAGRLLRAVDQWLAECGDNAQYPPPEDLPPTVTPARARLSLPLDTGEIRTVLWACGYHPDFSWLDLPVLDRKGMMIHDGGVTPLPGLYVLGLPFLRRRKSSFIYGASNDAEDICTHLAGYLAGTGSNRAAARCA